MTDAERAAALRTVAEIRRKRQAPAPYSLPVPASPVGVVSPPALDITSFGDDVAAAFAAGRFFGVLETQQSDSIRALRQVVDQLAGSIHDADQATLQVEITPAGARLSFSRSGKVNR